MPLFKLLPGLGVPVGLVTAEVATGLVVVQVRLIEQLLAPEEMVQAPDVKVPDMVVETQLLPEQA